MKTQTVFLTAILVLTAARAHARGPAGATAHVSRALQSPLDLGVAGAAGGADGAAGAAGGTAGTVGATSSAGGAAGGDGSAGGAGGAPDDTTGDAGGSTGADGGQGGIADASSGPGGIAGASAGQGGAAGAGGAPQAANPNSASRLFDNDNPGCAVAGTPDSSAWQLLAAGGVAGVLFARRRRRARHTGAVTGPGAVS